jgi:hypothetical protein
MDCPHPPPGQASNQGEPSTSKGPSVSLITPAVQLVTTCNRSRTEQWAEQDRVHEQAHHWVEEANAPQNAEMQTQGAQRAVDGKALLTEATGSSSSGIEPDISDFDGIQVTMTLEQLLRLVPRFREEIRRTLVGTAPTPAPAVQLTEVDKWVMDCECPSMEAIVGRQKIVGILIDGGSGGAHVYHFRGSNGPATPGSLIICSGSP